MCLWIYILLSLNKLNICYCVFIIPSEKFYSKLLSVISYLQTRQQTDLDQDLYFTNYWFKFWGPLFFVFTFSVVLETFLECVHSEWAVCQNLASDILTSRFLLENFCTNSHLAIRVLCLCSNLSRKYGQYKLRIKFSLRINCGHKFHRVIHLLVAGFPCRAVEETNLFPWEHQ